EYNQLGDATPLPSYVRTVFANPEMSRRIQSEDDLAARLIGRCFSSLVARKLAQDIGSPAPDLVAVLHETTPLGQRSRALDLRVDRLRQIVEGLSVAPDVPGVTRLELPGHEPGLGSPAMLHTLSSSVFFCMIWHTFICCDTNALCLVLDLGVRLDTITFSGTV
ncbi:hypothetical protein EDB84DRAFT_1503951, partial [Lactarius hengduanensis]